MIQPANRVNEVQEYYFSRKLKEVAQMNAEGMDIISLAIGSPDMPPSKQTIDKLCEVAQMADAHGYQPSVGIPELRQAMANFYKKWYDVDLDWKSEIQPLIGSKEGILYTTLALCNPGDEVLIPDPGYPTYTSLNKILGTKITYYTLCEDKGWQPDFDALEKLFKEYKGEIAAVITEPVELDEPKNDFLNKAKELCHANGALMIFDEVVDGFRFSIGGAQKFFGVTPGFDAPQFYIDLVSDLKNKGY